MIFLMMVMTVISRVTAQPPDGWKITDRFGGFRFEMIGKVRDVGLRHAIQKKANELACFGWVQYSSINTKSVVGEVRCNKKMTNYMKQWMTSTDDHPVGSFVENVEIKDYEDTKIKLHFSHFKILNSQRETCFNDAPHRCIE